MSELATVTKEEFEKAIDKLSDGNDLEFLCNTHNEAPEHIRPLIQDAILKMLKRINSNSEDSDGFRDLANKVLDSRAVDDFRDDHCQSKELFVEFAIIFAFTDTGSVTTHLERSDLIEEDRKRIIDAALIGMKADSKNGWADSISILLDIDNITPEQAEAICQELDQALDNLRVDIPTWETCDTVLYGAKNVPIEIRRKALQTCAFDGEFEYVIEMLDKEDADLLFEGKENFWLAIAVVSADKFGDDSKIKSILEFLRNKSILPENVRELLPGVFQSTVSRYQGNHYFLDGIGLRKRIDFFSRLLKAYDVPNLYRQIIENEIEKIEQEIRKDWPSTMEDKDSSKKPVSPKEEIPENVSVMREESGNKNIVHSYIKQIGDQGKKGLMEPNGKKRGCAKSKVKPRIPS
jgi:hypothetical protein